jgi:hypothetical protein
MMPVRPFYADAIHRITDPEDLPGDRMRQEIERDFPLSHGFALRHPVFRLPGASPSFLLIVIIFPIMFPGFFPARWTDASSENLRLPEDIPVWMKWPFSLYNQNGILPDTANSFLSSLCGLYAITSLLVNPGTGTFHKNLQ